MKTILPSSVMDGLPHELVHGANALHASVSSKIFRSAAETAKHSSWRLFPSNGIPETKSRSWLLAT